VLDTDHLSLNPWGNPKIRERLVLIPADEIAITIITAEEQLRGRLEQHGLTTVKTAVLAPMPSAKHANSSRREARSLSQRASAVTNVLNALH